MKAILSVGVVGAGTMGLGIAQVCASAGFKTLLYDVNPDQVTRAMVNIEKSLSDSVVKGKITAFVKSEILSRIHPIDDLSLFRVDLVIEAAVERLDIKKELFIQLEKINKGSILATNTSSISVSQIASALEDPTVCIGLHFFNPADRMKLVEVISGESTQPVIRETIRRFAKALGKIPVVAKDSPGFIVNRVARHYYVESLKQLEDGAADVETIDALLRSAGFKMGPFELMDLIGVDTNLSVTTSIYEGFDKAHKFRPSKIQQRLVSEGHFGRKSGRGFYAYQNTAK
jgi:3-hydroxybutyryl-CoA dehydrogenase